MVYKNLYFFITQNVIVGIFVGSFKHFFLQKNACFIKLKTTKKNVQIRRTTRVCGSHKPRSSPNSKTYQQMLEMVL